MNQRRPKMGVLDRLLLNNPPAVIAGEDVVASWIAARLWLGEMLVSGNLALSLHYLAFTPVDMRNLKRIKRIMSFIPHMPDPVEMSTILTDAVVEGYERDKQMVFRLSDIESISRVRNTR